ncbi:O-antigen ligase family protein [Clostridium perfringens]|uniref:O-antigen ligase family protein n=1 Tax=Clostridium perfringens TaxID=1502 RepID=UPI002ACC1ECE|nr:O-antigen ligase family protein [Clostridium perfringens]
MKYIIPVFLFDILIMIFEIFTGNLYIKSNFIYPLHISAFILIVSYLIGQVINKDLLIRKISNSYIFSSVFVGIYIYIFFLKDSNWIDGGYLYTSKNSICVILLISLIFLFLTWEYRNKSINLCISFFLLLLIVMLRSRNALLSGIIVIFYFLFFTIENKKKKYIFILILLTIIIIILTNDNLYNIFINNIIFNNKEEMGLDSISSGRIQHLKLFIPSFKENWLIGNGGIYLESFPLAALSSYGIIAAGLLFIFAFVPIIIVFKNRKNNYFIRLRKIILLISIVMIINSIFEELSPFGPGIKCYILWLLTGIYLAVTKK